MKTAPFVFVAVMAIATSVRSQITGVVDSRESQLVPAGAPATARILGDLADGTPAPPAAPRPALIVAAKDILRTKTIQQGGRKITIQRITPIASPPPDSAPLTEAYGEAACQEPTAEPAPQPIDWDFLMLGATVFRFKDAPPRTLVTCWPAGRSGSVSLWSSADFGLLSGFSDFVAANGHAFSMFLMWSYQDIDRIDELQDSCGSLCGEADILEFANGKASFTTTGDAPADEEVLAPIQALHEIYNNQLPRLAAAYQARERARVQREADLEANPPRPQDVIIRYAAGTKPAPPTR